MPNTSLRASPETNLTSGEQARLARTFPHQSDNKKRGLLHGYRARELIGAASPLLRATSQEATAPSLSGTPVSPSQNPAAGCRSAGWRPRGGVPLAQNRPGQTAQPSWNQQRLPRLAQRDRVGRSTASLRGPLSRPKWVVASPRHDVEAHDPGHARSHPAPLTILTRAQRRRGHDASRAECPRAHPTRPATALWCRPYCRRAPARPQRTRNRRQASQSASSSSVSDAAPSTSSSPAIDLGTKNCGS